MSKTLGIVLVSCFLLLAGLACDVVDYTDPTADDIPILIQQALRDDQTLGCAQACRVMRNISSIDGGVDALIMLLQDEDPEMRVNAAMFLGDLVADGSIDLDDNAGLVPSLLDTFNDENPDVRVEAVEAIADCATRDRGINVFGVTVCSGGPQAGFIRTIPSVVTALSDVLQDENELVRDAAVAVLVEIAPLARTEFTNVNELLVVHGDFFIRLDAAMNIAEDGGDVTLAVPVLIDGIENGETLLAERDDESLNLDYYPIAGNCAYYLGLIGRDAVDAIPVMARLIGSDNVTEHRNAIDAIMSIDPQGKFVTDPMIELLSSDDPDVRETSARILGTIGPGARDALPLLKEIVENESGTVRMEMESAIELIDIGVK
jgi:HEAT repeat protein